MNIWNLRLHTMGVYRGKMITEYYSKWRGCWVKFKTPPGPWEITQMQKHHYKMR